MSLWLMLTGAALAVLVVAARRRPPVRLHASADRPCAVYIIPSRDPQRPAYIGEGYDPYRRIACHRRDAWWRRHADWATPPTIEWLPSKAAARAREQQLIGELAPLFNDRHNRGRGQRRPVVSHPDRTVDRWEARS
jgi:hypothetical protein